MKTKTLEQVRAAAQADANRTGEHLVIFNLNRFAPMYVARKYFTGADTDPQFVELVRPNAPKLYACVVYSGQTYHGAYQFETFALTLAYAMEKTRQGFTVRAYEDGVLFLERIPTVSMLTGKVQ